MGRQNTTGAGTGLSAGGHLEIAPGELINLTFEERANQPTPFEQRKQAVVKMPELPEVEAARKFVEEHCLGHPIVRATVADDSVVLSDVSPAALEEALVGKTIVRAHRKGKHLWWELDRRPWPSFQFGMTGNILIKDFKGVKYKRAFASDNEEWPSKFSKVLVELENGVEMAFTDKRRFARVRLLQDPRTESPISELGPDAHSEYPDEDTFVQALQQRKGVVKSVLLDQTFLAGIGNWIADEVLYQARLHPARQVSSLTSEDCKTLYYSIKEVVEWSVKVNSDHEQFPKSWIFHQRWNKKPGSLEGHEIKFITVGGRTSAYVPALQKNTGLSTRMVEEETTTTFTVTANVVTTEKMYLAARGRGRRGKPKKTYAEEAVVPEEEVAAAGVMISSELATDKSSPKARPALEEKVEEAGNDPSGNMDEPDTHESRKGLKRKRSTKASLNSEGDEVMEGNSDAKGGQKVKVVASRRSSRMPHSVISNR
ncbi:hypothetical protein R1flu_010702 [Riccia fluitans]|uniref:Formamidopyrimidine-DNA glycosylase catalytic domain-containing protein n=1 Tax=Riccia fluitans TaxID=41844 RepID=A0ABD1Z6G9_9MARC